MFHLHQELRLLKINFMAMGRPWPWIQLKPHQRKSVNILSQFPAHSSKMLIRDIFYLLSASVISARNNRHKNMADTVKRYLSGYLSHYRAGYYVNVLTNQTRTTNVVRNAGCARSRYTLKFFFNELMNQWINKWIN